MSLFTFIMNNSTEILARTIQHVQMTLLSIGIAVLIGVPLGILINYIALLKKPVIGTANVMQAIPTLALLGFLVPFMGIGEKPAIVMVVVYSLLPIIKNTVTGLAGINAETLEAAKGIGMTRFQILLKIKIPLALPVIMAGVRIAAVTAVGLVIIGAFIGAGGLGFMIQQGIRTVNNNRILAGAIPACLLALFVDWLGALIEKVVTPVCFKVSAASER